jgi:SecD/SecF fusion protein
MPILALLLFGGATLKDFAFALLIGVASGAYSSIFIASPVLTHWKERESHYRHRRERIEEELGYVPAYADDAADIEPEARRARRTGRITAPEPDTVSAAEFEAMKRDLGIEDETPGRHTSTLTKRLAHSPDAEAPAARPPKRGSKPAAKPSPPPAARKPKPAPAAPGETQPGTEAETAAPENGDADGFVPAPDIAENEGVAPTPETKRTPKSRSRNRRHGRRR